MNHLVVTIHGNPGYAESMIPLAKSCLPEKAMLKHYQLRTEEPFDIRQEFRMLDRIIDNEKKVSFITYSWGAYLALRYLMTRNMKAHKIVCLNPTLHVDKGVSGLFSMIASIPVLGHLFFGSLSGKLVDDFCRKSFAPEKASKAFRNEFELKLGFARVWQRAIEVKNEQFEHPLSEIPELAEDIFLFFGMSDKSVPMESQMAAVELLARTNRKHVIEIGDTGHSLPWTHREDLKPHLENVWRQK